MDAHLIFLLTLGFLAGLMDAAVGGGGLLQIPGLFNFLPRNMPVATVMGINKFASFCGTLTATGQFVRRITVPWKMLLPAAMLAFLASYSGARLVSYIPVQYMKPAMLAIMAVMFVYTFCKKDLGQAVRTTALSRKETAWGLFFGALIGFYDGVFGPGTGGLLAFIFVRFFAYDFLTATASAKVINLTTNLAALSFFCAQRPYCVGVGAAFGAGQPQRRLGGRTFGHEGRQQISALRFYGAFVHHDRQIRLGLIALGPAHNSSCGNLLVPKCACCVENARKVFNLAALSPCKHAFALKSLRAIAGVMKYKKALSPCKFMFCLYC